VSAVEWVWMGGALWLAVGVPLAFLVGRVIRGRDTQIALASRSTCPDLDGIVAARPAEQT